jgi:hypothetical protein
VRAHRLTSVRCGILLLSAHGGSRALVRENNPRSGPPASQLSYEITDGDDLAGIEPAGRLVENE